jgi:hypothetical protein
MDGKRIYIYIYSYIGTWKNSIEKKTIGAEDV